MLNGIEKSGNYGTEPQKYGNSNKAKESTDSKLSISHYESDSVSLSYKSTDGSELKIEVNHSEVDKLDISKYSKEDKDMWHKIVKKIKEEFADFKKKAINDLLTDAGYLPQKPDKKITVKKDDASTPIDKTAELIDKMPDQWKPEAVAQRIFDFTTAYYGSTESQGEDFYNLAKDSILEGFNSAYKDMDLDSLPDEVKGVTQETLRLVFEKLDAWAEDNGILPKPEDGSVDLTA